MDNRRHTGLGVLVFIMQLFNYGVQFIPPVTFAIIICTLTIFSRLIPLPWNASNVCSIGWDWKRLLFSSFDHVSDFHAYYVLGSIFWKSLLLEMFMGSRRFLVLFVCFYTSVVVIYLAIIGMLSVVINIEACPVGLLGVVFAMKVIIQYYGNPGTTEIYGFILPFKLYAWAELLVVEIVIPTSPTLFHIAGILVGILYVKGPLMKLVDIISRTNHPINQIQAVPAAILPAEQE